LIADETAEAASKIVLCSGFDMVNAPIPRQDQNSEQGSKFGYAN